MVGVYGKFLNLVKAFQEATPTWPQLDAVEERLLNSLASKWHTLEPITVLDAANMLPGVSESTALRRLNSLVDKGVICFESSREDGRIKLVNPTNLTIKYFDQLGNCLNLSI